MYRTMFWWMLAASLVGLTLSAISKSSPTTVFLVGLTPLVIYHLILVREANKRLSQMTIDSVYYFGFLVTIATLAVSVLLVSYAAQQRSPEVIINQFGLGLLATGYALFARMHLMTIVDSSEELDPISLAEQYARKVREVAERITVSAIAFETFATTITDRNRVIVETSTNTLERLSVDVAQRLQNDMASALAEIRTSVEAFSRAMNESKLTSEIDTLKQQMRGFGGSITSASTRIKSLHDSTALVDAKFSKLSTSSENLHGALDKSLSKLEQLPAIAQQFVQLKEVLTDVCNKVRSANEQLAALNNTISQTSNGIVRSYDATAATLTKSATNAENAVNILTKDLTKMVDYIIDQTRGGDPRS